MPFSIDTNIASLQAQNYLQQTSNFQNQTIDEVSSGLRIINSGDDAAGLAIANGYRSDQAVLTEGIQNSNDGLATLQTIDGGMNNISKLLDRASTLATESASGTFTGDRATLNSEFQSVIGEINRQAQTIGMNQGGPFAQALSIFIGGGKGTTNAASNINGSISVDLSQSAVDAQSLGLQGVQANGTAGTDIGTGSAATSVQDILATAANSASEGTPGSATFTFSGPGYADSNKVSISVDLAGVTDTTTLATAINSAIQNAGNGTTQYATAFKNANISASTVTDSQGRQQLSFSSSFSAFQVQAGDRTANALLGNFSQNAGITGTDLTPAIAAGSSFSTLKIDGNAVTLAASTLSALAAGGSKASIVNTLNSDAGFSAVATASLIGNRVVIQSDTNGPASSVQVAGSLATALGLSTTVATAASAATGASLNTTVTGAGATSDNSSLIGSVLGSTVIIPGPATNAILTSPSAAPDMGIAALNGGAGVGTVGPPAVNDTLVLNVDGVNKNVTIQAGDKTLAAVVNDINNTTLNPGLGVHASTGLTQKLVLTSTGTPGPSDNVALVAGGTTPELLTGSPLGFVGNETASGTAAGTENNLLNVTVGSNAPVPLTLANGTYTAAQMVTQINTQLTAASVAATASLDTAGHLVLTANQPGTSLALNSVIGSAYSALGLTAGTSSTAVAASSDNIQVQISGGGMSSPVTLALNPTVAGTTTVASVLADLTSKVSGSSALTAAGISLTSNTDGNNLVFTDDKGEKFQVAVTGDSNNILGFGSFKADATGDFDYSTLTGNASLGTTTAAATLNISVNGGATTPINVGAASTPAATLIAINDQINTNPVLSSAGLQASLSGTGALVLTSTNHSNFRVSGGGADLGFGANGGAYSGSINSAAPTAGRVDSAGAYTTTAMAFTPMVNGADNQTISITATDSNGASHSLAIPLQNNSTAQTGDNIDDALHAINTALQQSNDSTLQSIYAVKEDNSNGAESIKFMSTTQNFKVAVSSLSDLSGIAPPAGGISTATQNGTGADVNIDSISGAEAAVNALTAAVQNLGSAQAAVGKGENLLNYGTNLAQSQLTDEASSESQIRDANLAQEAANLTKAQILMQAGTAALSQANSAPQQLISLLQSQH